MKPRPKQGAAATARRLYRAAMAGGIAIVALRTVPSLPPTLSSVLDPVFWGIAALVALECAARLTGLADRLTGHSGPRPHIATPRGLVDIAACAPLAALALGAPAAEARLWGALWVLKLAQEASGLGLLGRVLQTARGPLLSLLEGFLIVLVLAATLAYLLEGGAQPDTFGSIPLALWWAITTLTTVGYGDAVPVTVGGRILGGVVMVCGIGVFALWAGILATTFADEIRRRDFLRNWELVVRVPFFGGLGAGLIAEVARLLKTVDAAAGATLIRRGEPGECMYFIASGTVAVDLAPPVTLGPGAFFGEIALVTGGLRSATVVAATDCQLLKLDVADFRALADRHPDLAAAIAAEAARRQGESGVALAAL